jgi:hypothetical protein
MSNSGTCHNQQDKGRLEKIVNEWEISRYYCVELKLTTRVAAENDNPNDPTFVPTQNFFKYQTVMKAWKILSFQTFLSRQVSYEGAISLRSVGVHTGSCEFISHKYPIRTRDLVIKYKTIDSLEAHVPLDIKEIRI